MHGSEGGEGGLEPSDLLDSIAARDKDAIQF